MAEFLNIFNNSNEILLTITLSEITERVHIDSKRRIIIYLSTGKNIILEFLNDVEYNNALLSINWLMSDYGNRSLPDPNSTIPPGALKVYYKRPILTQELSYHIYDEGWRRMNGGNDYTLNIPADGIIQQIEIIDGRTDYLKYKNFWGHKFRFTDINGGYFDEVDGNYYLADGSPGVYGTTVYPFITGNTHWVIDNLSGARFMNQRQGATNWADYLDATQTYSYGGQIGGWLGWTSDEAHQLDNNNANEAYSILIGSGNRPFFIYSQPEHWTCTTRPGITTQAINYLCSIYGGSNQGRTKTTPVNKWYFTYYLNGYVIQ